MAEGARLLIECTLTRTEGSNPSHSVYDLFVFREGVGCTTSPKRATGLRRPEKVEEGRERPVKKICKDLQKKKQAIKLLRCQLFLHTGSVKMLLE